MFTPDDVWLLVLSTLGAAVVAAIAGRMLYRQTRPEVRTRKTIFIAVLTALAAFVILAASPAVCIYSSALNNDPRQGCVINSSSWSW